jgi:hypothetical protein
MPELTQAVGGRMAGNAGQSLYPVAERLSVGRELAEDAVVVQAGKEPGVHQLDRAPATGRDVPQPISST